MPSPAIQNLRPLELYARLPSGDIALELKKTKNGEVTVAPRNIWGRFKVSVLRAFGIETKAMRIARTTIYSHFVETIRSAYGDAGVGVVIGLGQGPKNRFPTLTADKVKEVLTKAEKLPINSIEQINNAVKNFVTSINRNIDFAKQLKLGGNIQKDYTPSPSGLSYFKTYIQDALGRLTEPVIGQNSKDSSATKLARELLARTSHLDALGLASASVQASEQIAQSSAAILEGLANSNPDAMLENVNKLTAAFNTFSQIETKITQASKQRILEKIEGKPASVFLANKLEDFLAKAVAKMSPEATQAARQAVPQMLEAATLALKTRTQDPVIGGNDAVEVLGLLANKLEAPNLGDSKPPTQDPRTSTDFRNPTDVRILKDIKSSKNIKTPADIKTSKDIKVPKDLKTTEGLARLAPKMALANSFGASSKSIQGADKFLEIMRKDLGKFIRLQGTTPTYSKSAMSPLLKQLINPKSTEMARNTALILKTYLDLEMEDAAESLAKPIEYWNESAALEAKLNKQGINKQNAGNLTSTEHQNKMAEIANTKLMGDEIWQKQITPLNKARLNVLGLNKIVAAYANKAGANGVDVNEAGANKAGAKGGDKTTDKKARLGALQMAQAELTEQMLMVYPWYNAHLNASPKINQSLGALAVPRQFKLMPSTHSPLGATWGIAGSTLSQRYLAIRQKTLQETLEAKGLGGVKAVATKALGEVEVREQSMVDFPRSEISIVENGKIKSLTNRAKNKSTPPEQVIEGLAQYIGNKKDLTILAGIMTQGTQADMVAMEKHKASLDARIPSPTKVASFRSPGGKKSFTTNFTLEKLGQDEYNISWTKPMFLGWIRAGAQMPSTREGSFDISGIHNENYGILNKEVINLKRNGNSWDISFPLEISRYDVPMNEMVSEITY